VRNRAARSPARRDDFGWLRRAGVQAAARRPRPIPGVNRAGPRGCRAGLDGDRRKVRAKKICRRRTSTDWQDCYTLGVPKVKAAGSIQTAFHIRSLVAAASPMTAFRSKLQPASSWFGALLSKPLVASARKQYNLSVHSGGHDERDHGCCHYCAAAAHEPEAKTNVETSPSVTPLISPAGSSPRMPKPRPRAAQSC
jgi:hypothetical protein